MDTNEERLWKPEINEDHSQAEGGGYYLVLGFWPDLHSFFKKSQKAEVLCETPWFFNISSSFKFKAPQANTHNTGLQHEICYRVDGNCKE